MATLGVFKKLFRMTKYEQKICFLLSLQGIMWTFQIMLPIVSNYTPDYHCSDTDYVEANANLAEDKMNLTKSDECKSHTLSFVAPPCSTLISYVVRIANTMMFYVVYLITPEMFPTAVRQAMVNLCASTSYFITVVLPLLLYGDPKLTSIITSSILLVAAFLNIFLPNTMNTPLPDTLQDCLNLKRDRVLCKKRGEDTYEENGDVSAKFLENGKDRNDNYHL